MVSTGAFNRVRIDLIVSYCSFQCSGVGCGLSRACCTGFCFFGAPEREGLALRLGSVASSSVLASVTFSTFTRLVDRLGFGVTALVPSAEEFVRGASSLLSVLIRFERRGAGVDPLVSAAESSAKI
jgi:hypothetical protein